MKKVDESIHTEFEKKCKEELERLSRHHIYRIDYGLILGLLLLPLLNFKLFYHPSENSFLINLLSYVPLITLGLLPIWVIASLCIYKKEKDKLFEDFLKKQS